MEQKPVSFAAAALVFLDALGRYQSATHELNVARQKLNASLIDFVRPLSNVVLQSGSAVAKDRRQSSAT